MSQVKVRELSFQVFVGDPPSGEQEWVGFECAGSRSDFTFTTLEALFQSLIQGQALPLTLVTRNFDRSFNDISKLVAMAMFLHRELAVRPSLSTLISSAVLVDKLEWVGLAHIDRDLAWFFEIVRSWQRPESENKREEGVRISSVIGWLREWVLNGVLPALPPEQAPPRVVSTGTNGFVLAELPVNSNLRSGWVELFREGHLKGLLVTEPNAENLRRVLVSKRSDYITFDLGMAQSVLNQAEAVMDGSKWVLETTCWLHSPEDPELFDGTLLPVSALMDVLSRM